MSYFFNKKKSSGVFVPDGNRLKEYKGDVGNGSINSVTLALGYHPDQLYSPILKGGNERIQYIAYEIFTRNLVYIKTLSSVTYLTQKDINKALGDFSVNKEFDNLRINEVLNDGVENGSLSIEFMSRILKMNDLSKNGFFYSEKIEAYLYFTDGFLSDFHFDDGLFPYAKQLRNNIPAVYKKIEDLAFKYWPDNKFQANKEINMQCEAWANLPNAYGNQFIPLHRTENGGVNLHMIRVCHYNYPIVIDQFIEINHGRYHKLVENEEVRQYRCGNFNYTFDKVSGDLLEFKLDFQEN